MNEGFLWENVKVISKEEVPRSSDTSVTPRQVLRKI